MNRYFPLFLCLLALIGCVTPASQINNVQLGMSQAQVVAIMGKPASVTADTKAKYLNYSLPEAYSYGGSRVPYEVKLVNDMVVSYGRAGATRTEAQP